MTNDISIKQQGLLCVSPSPHHSTPQAPKCPLLPLPLPLPPPPPPTPCP